MTAGPAPGHVVMGLLFFPRGGSAYVARYLAQALAGAGWSTSLVAGSLGAGGEATHAPTFFAGTDVKFLDYSGAQRSFEAGGSAFAAPVPMHPSYEDRDDAPDVVLSSVEPSLAERLASVWEAPLRAAGADRADVFHLHHLTPQHDAVTRCWPSVPVLAHLHGTELKFVEAVEERVAVAAALGMSLAAMAGRVPGDATGRALDAHQAEVLRTTRWSRWRHGEFWVDRLRQQAARADHVVAVSGPDRATAIRVLGVDPNRISAVPNGVDTERFRPRPMGPSERRAVFRRWLVEDPQGWGESGEPGTVAYQEVDLDRLVGPGGDATVLVYVGRFTAAKRVPDLVRAFALARGRFDRPASLLVWGGHPGEWEDEHPVTVAGEVGPEGIFFAGWRGHDDLPVALAVSDLLVMSSVNDSYPQAPLEAMAVGLPVVATTSGGFPSMINIDPGHPTGWLVPPEDVEALAGVLVEAVADPAERARRGANALAHARAHLSWHGLVPRFEAAYARAAERRRPRMG